MKFKNLKNTYNKFAYCVLLSYQKCKIQLLKQEISKSFKSVQEYAQHKLNTIENLGDCIQVDE